MPESHSQDLKVVRKASYWNFYFSHDYPTTSSRCLGPISYDKISKHRPMSEEFLDS